MDGLLGIGSIVLGIMIWFAFNKFVTRFYFGSSCLSIIISIVCEIFACVIIAGMILSFFGGLLGGIIGFIGGVILFLIKAVLVLAGIGVVAAIIYFVYCKIKGKDINVSDLKEKVKDTFNNAKSEDGNINVSTNDDTVGSNDSESNNSNDTE